MNQSPVGSDIKEDEIIDPQEQATQLLKRKSEKISNTLDNDTTNNELEDLYNTKRVKHTKSLDLSMEEKVPVQLHDKSYGDTIIKEEIGNQNNSSQKKQEKPDLYINRLKYYSQEQLPENCVSFTELLYEDLQKRGKESSKKTLISAFMSSFVYDQELLTPLLHEGVKITLATQLEEDDDKGLKMSESENFKIIYHQKNTVMNFVGALRSKLWVLKFPTFIRVVITSANLTILDWSVWNNVIWFRDFPKILDHNVHYEKKKSKKFDEFDYDTDFKATLKYFLNHLMPRNTAYTGILDFNLDDYIFSNIDVILIPSVPGRYRDRDFDKMAHRKLSSIIKKLDKRPLADQLNNKSKITYQTSSVGYITEKSLKELLSGLIPNFVKIDEIKAEKRYMRAVGPTGDNLLDHVKVVFPSKKYVKHSIEGVEHADCLALNPDCFYHNEFIKDMFCDFEVADRLKQHGQTISHANLFVVANEKDEIDDDSYVYFGSHSLSGASWGKYEKGYNQLAISNFDLGIFIPPLEGSKARKEKFVENLPFNFPPKRYTKMDLPWIHENTVKEDEEN